MKVYFATSRSISNNKSLNSRGATKRLLSFYMCQSMLEDELRRYKETGLFSKNKSSGGESDDQIGDR